MGKILYHIKSVKFGKSISIDNVCSIMEYNELKGRVALRVLESLKNQNVLDVVVYTSDNNETINLV